MWQRVYNQLKNLGRLIKFGLIKDFWNLRYILLKCYLDLIVALPLYFNIGSEMENQFLKVKDELRAYALKVENRIYKFSNSNAKRVLFSSLKHI